MSHFVNRLSLDNAFVLGCPITDPASTTFQRSIIGGFLFSCTSIFSKQYVTLRKFNAFAFAHYIKDWQDLEKTPHLQKLHSVLEYILIDSLCPLLTLEDKLSTGKKGAPAFC